MLRRLLGAAAAGALLAACGSSSPSTHTSPPDRLASAAQAAQPTFPPQVLSGPAPQQIDGRRCTLQASGSSIGIDARTLVTVPQLFADSDLVVIADVVAQHAYWQERAGRWLPLTMTQYRVVRVVKGPAVAWLQASDLGASSSAIDRCRNLAYTVANLPLPTPGQRYVLLGKHNAAVAGGVDAGTLRRFPVVDGLVETEAALHPAASISTVRGYSTPLSVEAFLALS